MVIGTRGGGGGELPYVVGTYSGNNDANRTISVGFTPSAVLVFPHDVTGSDEMFIVKGVTTMYYDYSVGKIVDGGFMVGMYQERGNNNRHTYIYIAFK